MSEPKTSSYFINSIKRSVMNDHEEREMEWTCGTHTKTLQIKLSKTCIYEFMWVTWRGEGERERPGHSSSNHKPVFRSRDLSPPIRGQYLPEPHCTGSRRLYKCPLSVPLSPALLSQYWQTNCCDQPDYSHPPYCWENISFPMYGFWTQPCDGEHKTNV